MFKTFALAASFVLVATPAIAADRSDSASTEIRIDDLDLASATDRERLDRRVTSAARRICDSGVRTLSAIAAEQRCVALALQSAAPQTERAVALANSNRRLAQIDLAVAG